MDRSGVKNFPSSWELGGGLFCHKNQSCSKLPEMDRSGVKKFSLILGGRGCFSATKTKVAQNCLKWIDLMSKIFPSSWKWGGGAGLFCHKNQSCSKLPEVDRSGVKKISLICGGGGLFCHKNQSCSKLPEMDRSGVKKFSLILGGGGFSATQTKVAQNFLKWIDLVSKVFPSCWRGGGAFLPQKPKLLKNSWNE